MVVKTIRKRGTIEMVKEELLNSLRENDAVEEPGLNIDNVTDPGESILLLIAHFTETLRKKSNFDMCLSNFISTCHFCFI